MARHLDFVVTEVLAHSDGQEDRIAEGNLVTFQGAGRMRYLEKADISRVGVLYLQTT